jgi:hypothetical protein
MNFTTFDDSTLPDPNAVNAGGEVQDITPFIPKAETNVLVLMRFDLI